MENTQPTRRCKKCGKIKELADFPIYDVKRGARRHACEACNTARVEDWHREHKEERLAEARARYAADPSSVWTPERRDRANKRAVLRHAELRDIVLHAYGGKCSCCGEGEMRFLTIDHVNGDGKEDRKVYRTGTRMLISLIQRGYPETYQVLCMNCNFGRAMNGGTCPHKVKEGPTTIPQGSTAERPEVPRTQKRYKALGRDIV